MNFTCMSQFSLKRQHSIHLHEVWILINMLNFTNNTHICVDKKSSYTYLSRWMIKPISNVSSAWPKYFEWYINIEVVVLYFITTVIVLSIVSSISSACSVGADKLRTFFYATMVEFEDIVVENFSRLLRSVRWTRTLFYCALQFSSHS